MYPGAFHGFNTEEKKRYNLIEEHIFIISCIRVFL